MGRSHFHPAICRNFETPGDHTGSISATGLCPACGKRRLSENVDQMESRSGPNWTKWRRSMVLCAHPELLDVLDANP